jgi:hypothetical protein
VLKSEKETTIRWDSAEKVVHIFTCHRSVWRRAERAGFKPVRVQTQNERDGGVFYEIPLANFRFGFRALNRPRRPAPKGAFKPKTRDQLSRQ